MNSCQLAEEARESGHEGLRKLKVSSHRRGYRMGVHILPVIPILFSYQAVRREDGFDVGGVRVQSMEQHAPRLRRW